MSKVDISKLPYLLELIDDDNEEIKAQVINELKCYGTCLEHDLKTVSESFDFEKSPLLKPIILENRRNWFKEQWLKTIVIENELLLLERGLELVTKFQYGIDYNFNLHERIKNLAYEFNSAYPYGSVLELATFLFVDKDFKGAKTDYYNPLNSNIIYTIDNSYGLPLTLTILYILVAKELEFRVEGCRFPGHYLAKAFIYDRFVLVDCFNRGRLIFEKELRYIAHDSYEPFMAIISDKTTTKMMLSRILANLSKAYENSADEINKVFFEELVHL